MKTKFIQIVPVLIALLAIGFRYFSNWCIDTLPYCYGTWVHQIALSTTTPLYLFALFFLPMAVLLIFVPRDTFKAWVKLTIWALPLAVLFIMTTPVSFHGLGIDLLPFYRDDAARFAGGVYALGSLWLIVSRTLLARAYAKSPAVSSDGFKEYLASWRAPLASVAGLLLTVIFATSNLGADLVLGIASLLGSFILNAYAAWCVFVSWPNRDFIDKFLRYATAMGVIGFFAIVLIVLSPALRDMFADATLFGILILAAVFAAASSITLVLQAIKDIVTKMLGKSASYWRFILALSMLAGSFATLIFAIVSSISPITMM